MTREKSRRTFMLFIIIVTFMLLALVTPADAMTIAGGVNHTIAVKEDGTVWAWGRNYWGNLGDGTMTDRSTPVRVSGLTGVTAIAGGESHTIALKGDGTVWAWGDNQYGELGDGTMTDRSTPVQVSGLTGVTAIDGGDHHTIALKGDGTVWAWGYNYYGQLGDGTTTNRSTPVQVGGLTMVTAIARGANYTIALKGDGTVWAWGRNYSGNLGDGTTANRSTPVQVSGLTGVTAIDGGGTHTIALKGDGTVWAWGYNQYGQLGDGTMTDRSTPVQVSGLTGITAIAGGDIHTIARKGDGTVWAWGNNQYGQLGDGTTANRSTPVQVSGLTGVTAIAGGGTHTIALKGDGTVWAWGYNSYGQLGDGTTANRSTPVRSLMITTADIVWVPKANMPAALINNMTNGAVVNNRLYVMGMNGVFEYNPTTNTWATKASMNVPRATPVIGVVNNKIYAIGGEVPAGAPSYPHSAAVEEYDPATNTWTTKTSMPVVRNMAAGGVINNKIYVIAGHNTASGDLGRLDIYDPATDTWSTGADMLLRRSYLTAAVLNGKLYAIGGFDVSHNYTVANVEVYDPLTNTWMAKANLNIPRATPGATVVKGRLYVLAGEGPTLGFETSIEVYDPLTDSWALKKNNLLIPRATFGYGTINNKIYVAGGSNAGGLLTAVEEGSFGSVIQLPKTGQTKCYDAAGTEMSCAGTGQDGEIQAGVAWPVPRFTDNGDQTVADNLTGLVWAKDGNLMTTRDPGFDSDFTAGDGMVTWQHALDYIKKLNQENYLGHNDWRLPNVAELESLVHTGQANNANWLNTQGFTNVPVNWYWSSSTYPPTTGYAWVVSTYSAYGYVDYHNKPNQAYVWPVRSGQSGSFGSSIISLPRTGQTTCYNASGSSIACTGTGQDGELQIGAVWPGTRFANNGDQTATDNLTGLIWTKEGNAPGPAACGPGSAKTWQGALDYVKCLNTNNYLGHNGWRLPNWKELRSLVHAGQTNSATWLNTQGFTNVQALYYWSSSTRADSTDYAWLVNMDNGRVDNHVSGKSSNYYVWPVRSGIGSAIISINSGAVATKIPSITLGISAYDSNGITQMMISNDVAFTGATKEESYAPSTAWTLSSGDGEKTVYVKFKDAAGNWSQPFSDTIILDTVLPVTTVSGKPDATTNSTSATFTFSSEAGATFQCQLDSGSWGACTSPVNYSSLASGSHTFNIKAMDTAGNIEATIVSYSWTIDVTGPNAPVFGTVTTPTNDQTPTWAWSSGGGGGNGTFRYKLDSSDLTTGATETTTASYTPATNLSEGSHTLYVQERDAAGNWSSSGSKAIAVDITVPVGIGSGADQFTQIQSIPTNGAAEWKSFIINGETYLAVANEENGGSTFNSKVYKWNGNSFVEFQSIASIGAMALESFVIDGINFLAIGNYWNGSTRNIDSKIYRWNGSSFVDFQSIPTNAESGFKSFIIGGETYLAVANQWDGSNDNIQSKIYKWNGSSFILYQSILTTGAHDWESFVINGDTYLAVANYSNNSNYNANSKIYKWNGASFAEFQSIPTNGALDWHSFVIGSVSYLAVANYYNGSSYNINSKIYKWNGTAFAEFQLIPTTGAYKLESFVINGETYLAIANSRSSASQSNIDSKIYKWNGTAFAEFQSIPTNSALDWHSFVIDSVSYLAVANYYNGSSYNINSKIYRFVASGDIGISINSGAFATKSTSVTLNLSATDANGVTGMKLSNDAAFTISAEEAYATSRAWTLPSGDGEKTVYVKFKDAAGNWSQVYSNTIILDTTGPTVTANPAGGNYLSAQSVTLTCHDGTGSGCGNIYYTTNGTEPTTASAVYSGAINIPATTTLKFFAVDKLNTSGPVKTETYTIQGVSMLGGSIKVVKGETRATNVLLTSIGGFNSAMALSSAWQGNTPSNAVINFTPSSVTPTAGGASATVSMTAGASTTAGNYTLRVTATGGGFTVSADIPVTVGNTFVLVTDAAISGTKGLTLSPITTTGGIGTPSFTYTGALPPGVTLNADGTFTGIPAVRGTYTFTVQASDLDNHTLSRNFTLRVYDPAYRQLVLEAESWSVMKGAVSGSIVAKVVDDYGLNASVSSNTLINVSSSSSTGRFSVDYGMNFSPSNIFSPMIYQGYNSTELQYKDTTAGTFTLRATGKIGTPSQDWALGSHDIMVSDPAPGNLSVSMAGTGTGSISSNPTGISCGSDCQEAYPNNTVVTLTATADAGSAFIGWSGACTGMTCTVTMDASRNVTATFRDAAGPSVSAGGDRIKNSVFTQTATAIDANTMTYAWSKVSGPGSIIFGSINALATTISASVDGTYVIRFTATDIAGNQSYGDMTLTWDTSIPDTILSGQPANPTNATSATFGFSSPESGTAFLCQLDNGSYEGCTSPKSYTGLTAGSHTFSVKATDLAGNVDLTPATYAWTIDVTAPNAPVVSGATPVNNNKPTWTWTTGGNGGNGAFRYKLDNPDLTNGATETASLSYTPAGSLTESTHTLYVQERDAAGNWSNSGSASILVDTIAPTAVGGGILINTDAPATKTLAVTLSLGAFDANGVTLMMVSNDATFNGAAEAYAATKTWTLTSGDGVKTVYVKFRDGAGNWSGAYSDTILLDTTGPTVTANPSAGTYFTAKSVTLSCNDAFGSGCGNIYYTISGADPTTSSTVFNVNNPINISASTTLKYFAVDVLGNQGQIQTAVYLIQDVAISSGTIKVVKGEARQTTVTLTSIGGFNTAMSLSHTYQGATPVNAVVKIEPASVTPSAAGASAILTFTTDAQTAPGSYVIRVVAAGAEINRIVDVPVTVAAPAAITNVTLPKGDIGQQYASSMTVTGGIAPYTFTKVAGALPDGVTLSADGSFIGTPTRRGTYTFTIQAADSDGHILTREYSVRIYDPDYRTFLFEALAWSVEKSTSANSVWSDWIKVRVVNDYGNPVSVSKDTLINVTSSSSTGRIRNVAYVPSDPSNSFRLTVTAGSNFTEFQYKDTTAGALDITVSGVADYDSASWQSGSHAMTVTSPNLRNTSLTVAATQTSVYGQGVYVEGELRDIQSTPSITLAGKTVSIIFTSPSGGKTQAFSATTLSDGKYSYQAGASIIDAAGNWTVDTAFKDSEIYNDATARAGFAIAKADTRLTVFVNAKSTAPAGHITVSGQLYSYTAVPVKLSGIPIIIDFIKPDGSLGYSQQISTYDEYGHFTFTTSTAFAGIGLWKIKVRLAENSSLNISASEEKELIVANSAGYAIIIQGDYGGTYRDNYAASLDDIYNKLRTRSFPAENIYYLSYPNTSHKGITINDFTTKERVQNAITNWADARILESGLAPLYIIMMDHGSRVEIDHTLRGRFHIDPDTISPEELDAWLTTLEGKVQQPFNTIIVNGSCYSGSFIPKLSKAGRVIITSGMEDEQTSQGPQDDTKTYGEYFIYYLFNSLYNGANMRDSFREAAELTHKLRTCSSETCLKNSLQIGDNSPQHPLLDDNGDGKGSWMQVVGQGKGDGTLSSRLVLGLGINPVSLRITEVTPTQAIMQGAASFTAYAKTSDPAKPGAASWVEVKRPSYVSPDTGSGTGQVILNLPKIAATQYNSVTQQWEYSIAPLNEPGRYAMYYYVMDSDGAVIPPVMGTLYVNTSSNQAPASFNLTNPVNNKEEDNAWLAFYWDKAVDPNSDPVTYNLKIFDDETDTLIKSYDLLSREFYYMNAANENRSDGTALFVSGKYYKWQVEAVDNKGLTATSGFGRFKKTFTNVFNGFILGRITPAVSGAIINTTGLGAAISLPNGYFFMPHVAGDFALTVSGVAGYQPYSQSIKVAELAVATADITLLSEAKMKLTTAVSGTGKGTVSIAPPGTSCEISNCASFTVGTSITLTASPDSGSSFTGWSGACSGAANTCTLTMSADKTVTATFRDETQPVGSVSYAGGAYAKGGAVTLNLSATDPAGVLFMRFSSDGQTWESEESYGTTWAWNLTGADGLKTIYVQFKDGAGNWSAPYSKSITLDTSAPATTASPAGGSYAASQSVTLTANENATIYYTTDGSNPTVDSRGYSGPIVISGPADRTLKFFAKDNAGNTEQVRTATYSFDSAGPVGTIVINGGAARTNSATVTLTISAADPNGVTQMQFRTDNGEWSSPETYGTSKSLTLPSPDGSKTLYAKFRDGLGNWSEPNSATLILDTTAPITTASPAGGTYATAQSVTLTANEGATIYYTTDGLTPTESSFTYTDPIAIPATATKILKYFAKDLAGNIEPVRTQTYSFDRLGPTGAIVINNGAGRTGNAVVALTLTASDPAGVSQMQFSTDNSAWTEPEPYAKNKSLTLFPPDGSKTVYVKYQDSLGNWSASYTSAIILDTTEPVTAANPQGGSYALSQSVTLTANESATIYYTTDGSTPTESSTVYTAPVVIPYSSGAVTLKFFARDNAGNLEQVKVQTYSFDASGPTGAIAINNGAGRTNNAAVTLTISATDPSGVTQMQFSTDNSVWSTPEAYGTGKSLTLPGPDGSKTVYAKFKDGLGTWSAPVTATISLDTTKPITAANPAGGTYATTRLVTLTANEGASIYYTTDGSPPTEFSTLYTTPIVIRASSSVIALKFFAIDSVGNMESVKTETYSFDTTRPTGTISINGGAGRTNNAIVALTLSATDSAGIAQMQFSTDNSVWSTPETYGTSKSLTLPVPDGIRTVYVKFKNGLGNWSVTYSASIILDTTAPDTTASPAGGIYGPAQIVTLVANETATIYYTIDGSEPTESSSVYKNAMAIPVAMTLKYFASDLAGNLETVKTQTYVIKGAVLDGNVIINGGAPRTKSRSVTLNISVTSDSGVVRMQFSNEGTNWSTEEAFAETKNWTLSEADGLKTVHVRFGDGKGNWSPAVLATITLDTVAPVTKASPQGGTYGASVHVSLYANERDAIIYYTTDGTNPSELSSVYVAPIPAESSTAPTTIKFFAVDLAGNAESLKSETYTIKKGMPGDLNDDGVVNFDDAIIALQIMAGMKPQVKWSDFATSGIDVDGDGRLGPQEVIFMMQKAAELR